MNRLNCHCDSNLENHSRGFRVSATGIIALIALVYLCVCFFVPVNGFWINDNGCKFIQAEGLLENHYRQVSIPWPGGKLDPSYRYNPLAFPFGQIINGRLYGYYSYPFAFLSSVGYGFLGFKGLYLFPFLCLLLLLYAVWHLAEMLPGKRYGPPLAVILTAFCSPIWFYALSFWEHLPSAALAVCGLLFLFRFQQSGRKRHIIISAVSCGLAIYMRDELYLWAAALAFVSLTANFRDWKNQVVFLMTLALVLLPLWCFNQVVFDNPLGCHAGSFPLFNSGIGSYVTDRLQVLYTLLLNGHRNPWLSLLATGPFLILMSGNPRFDERKFHKIVGIAAAIALAGGAVILAGRLFDKTPVWSLLKTNGFFAVAPVMIFAFIRKAAVESPRQIGNAGDVPKLIWRIVVFFMLLYILLCPWQNAPGIHWGCRFWLPLYGLVIVLAASTLAQWFEHRPRHKLSFALILLVIGLSFSAQIYSLYLLRERKRFFVELNRIVAESAPTTIVAVGFPVPQDLAQNFYRKEIFLAARPNEIGNLLAFLREKNVRQVQIVSSVPLRIDPPRDKITITDGLNFSSYELYLLKLSP